MDSKASDQTPSVQTVQQDKNSQKTTEEGYFSELFSKFLRSWERGTRSNIETKAESSAINNNKSKSEEKPQHDQLTPATLQQPQTLPQQPSAPTPPPPPPPPPQPLPKLSCRVPLSRRFAHPCTCNQSFSYQKGSSIFNTNNLSNNNNNNSTSNSRLRIPQGYSSPLHLYDPATKKCLPTSKSSSDMLLRDCHSHGINSFAVKSHHGFPCGHEDLICDARKSRCICKPPLHLYYEITQLANGHNQTTFGCVPIGPTGSPDGRINCRQGQVYNMMSRECQKIFDVNELPNHPSGVSATQFSFVTIVLIWILLLVLIVTAKLRKLRSSTMYSRNSPAGERRTHHRHHSGAGNGGSSLHHNRNPATWLHPFIAAVNGHHHMNQHRRHSQPLDGTDTFNDTDFFLSNGRRITDHMLANENNLTSSQLSLNNPPPKFEEIYSATYPETQEQQQSLNGDCPPSNEDLPTYDEAMKLQNTMPPDTSGKE